MGIGVESGSKRILDLNLKKSTPDINGTAFKMLKMYGIRTKAFLIVGLPGETHETVRETIDWIEENEPDDLDVSIFQPLPAADCIRGVDPICHPDFRVSIRLPFRDNPAHYCAFITNFHVSDR